MACAHSRGASCRRIVTASPGSITWLDAASSSGSAIDSNCSRSDDVLVADIVSGTGVRALENSPRLHHAADWRRGSSTSTPMTPARGPSTTSPLAPFDTPFLSSKKSVLARLLVGWLSRQCTDEQGTAAVFRVLPPSASSGVFAAERRHRAVSYLFAAVSSRWFCGGRKTGFSPQVQGVRQDAAVQAARAARVAASFNLWKTTANPNDKRAATASQGGDGCEQGGRRVERAAARGALHRGGVGYWRRRRRSDASNLQRRRGAAGEGASPAHPPRPTHPESVQSHG